MRIERTQDRVVLTHAEIQDMLISYIVQATGRTIDDDGVRLTRSDQTAEFSAWCRLKDLAPGAVATPQIKVASGGEYQHRTLGRVLVISSHPHDGNCLIIEADGKEGLDDNLYLTTCEHSDLTPLLGESTWPFLGHGGAERLAEARATIHPTAESKA